MGVKYADGVERNIKRIMDNEMEFCTGWCCAVYLSALDGRALESESAHNSND